MVTDRTTKADTTDIERPNIITPIKGRHLKFFTLDEPEKQTSIPRTPKDPTTHQPMTKLSTTNQTARSTTC